MQNVAQNNYVFCSFRIMQVIFAVMKYLSFQGLFLLNVEKYKSGYGSVCKEEIFSQINMIVHVFEIPTKCYIFLSFCKSKQHTFNSYF